MQDTIMFQVDFQDFFREDIIIFTIDDCRIFEKTVTSNIYDESGDMFINNGFTGIAIMGFKVEDYIEIQFEEESARCKIIEGKYLKLTIFLNGTPNVFNVDLSKGKYIGFDKGESNSLLLHQSGYPFEYE